MFENKKFLPLIGLIFCLYSASAQIQQGLRNDNYAGILGSQLNPAELSMGKLTWDFNLASGGISFENNYGYIENSSLLDLSSRPDLVFRTDTIDENAENQRVIDAYDRVRRMDAYGNSFVQAVSGFFSLKNFKIGLSIKDRMWGSLSDIPINLGYYAFDRIPQDSIFNLNSSQAAAAEWLEISLHVSKNVKINDNESIAFGTNIKYLGGYQAAYAAISDVAQIAKTNQTDIDAANGRLKLGVVGGFEPGNIFNSRSDKNGTGLALDLGFIYKQSTEENTHAFKLGFSILDLGFIKFRKQVRTLDATFSELGPLIENYSGSLNPIEIYEEINRHTSDVSSIAPFALMLPTALSVQLDKAISKKIYVKALWVQRVNLSDRQLQRENIFALSPRLETAWLGFEMPVTFRDYKKMQIGAAARLGPVTIGSDNLQSVLFKQKEFTGSDIYFSVKINSALFSKEGGVKCWNHGKSGKRSIKH